MICFNCKSEIPTNSRFCLNCGVAQLTPVEADSALASDLSSAPERPSLNMAAIDLAARDRYSIGERGFGCVGIAFYTFIGLLMLIPGVPLLAFFGIPLALILAILTYRDVAHLQGKIKASFLRKLPGFSQGTHLTLALSVFCYLLGGSLISIAIMLLQFKAGHNP